MATAALAAFGTLLKIGDGQGSESFTTIAEVTKIGGPKFKLNLDDVTSHSSTSGWMENIPTTLDPGQVDIEISFIPTTATQSQTSGLLRDFKNKTKRNFQLIFPDTTQWAFAAYVVAFEPSAPVDKALSAKVTLDITGVPTLAG